MVSDGADNVLFVGFAPYENPEIVVAVVIEHGANSHFAAKIARDIFDAYMEQKQARSNPGSVEEEDEIVEDAEETKTDNPVSKENGKAPGVDSDQGKAPVEATVPKKKDDSTGDGTL